MPHSCIDANKLSHSQTKHCSRFISCKIGTHKRSCAQKIRVWRRISSVCRRLAPVALPGASIHTDWIYFHKLKLMVIDRISSANPSSTTMTTITHAPKAPFQTPSEFSAGTSVSPLVFLHLVIRQSTKTRQPTASTFSANASCAQWTLASLAPSGLTQPHHNRLLISIRNTCVRISRRLGAGQSGTRFRRMDRMITWTYPWLAMG